MTHELIMSILSVLYGTFIHSKLETNPGMYIEVAKHLMQTYTFSKINTHSMNSDIHLTYNFSGFILNARDDIFNSLQILSECLIMLLMKFQAVTYNTYIIFVKSFFECSNTFVSHYR